VLRSTPQTEPRLPDRSERERRNRCRSAPSAEEQQQKVSSDYDTGRADIAGRRKRSIGWGGAIPDRRIVRSIGVMDVASASFVRVMDAAFHHRSRVFPSFGRRRYVYACAPAVG
jgi:hypothetical protein